MRALINSLARGRRVLLFVAWYATLVVLLRADGYQAFLRPEFGVLLKGGGLILLLLINAELSRHREPVQHPTRLLSLAVLLLPILYMLNARGAALDGYAARKRLVGTPHVTSQEAATPERTTALAPPAATMTAGDSSAAAVCRADTGTAAGKEGPTSTASSTGSGGAPSAAVSAGLDDMIGRQPPSGAAEDVSIMDLYRHPELYEGRRVSLLAMTMRNDEVRKEFGSRSVLAFRFRVTCCAADAQPFAVVVLAKPGQVEYPDNQWSLVEGRFRTRVSRGEKIPVVEAASVSPTTKPRAPYMY